ncbi:MAG TPA: OmpH family outer membrane protein [Phenylobacterium sp.]|uniref:OmpH family outer membrane protein n=1 Tax=Phenylobacterium sp. TaxID=1871053 RepID=UPI002B49BAEE|nr:OmpH family outer membrane protein [Phenylobacterium sp.]HKR86539.1 OmpH family outer membrane protein [Phenylobacterium sp.]
MTIKTFALAACAGAAVLASGSSALAQTAAAAPSVTYGAPIAGLCVVSVDGVIGNSTVGKYVDQRLQQIGSQAQAELGGEKSGIDSEARTLEGQRATLDQNSFEQRVAALQVRQNALERKAALRERELQATQQQAVGRVINEMKPLIAAAAEQQKCAMVIDRSSVIMVNPSMDLTSAVVTSLNGKLTQFAFDRTRLDQQAQASAPPVTQTPAQVPAKRK